MTKRRTFNAYMAGLGAAVAFSVLPGIAMSQSASMSSDDAASSSEAYDATEVMQGVSEVLCYGTAVVVEPA